MKPIIWINGERGTWKQITDLYGDHYMRVLRKEVKDAPENTTWIIDNGFLEIYK